MGSPSEPSDHTRLLPDGAGQKAPCSQEFRWKSQPPLLTSRTYRLLFRGHRGHRGHRLGLWAFKAELSRSTDCGFSVSTMPRSHGKPQQSQGCGCPSLVFDTVLLSMLSWSLGPQAWEQCLTPVLLNKSWPGMSVPLLWATLGCPRQVQRESRPGRSSRGLG